MDKGLGILLIIPITPISPSPILPMPAAVRPDGLLRPLAHGPHILEVSGLMGHADSDPQSPASYTRWRRRPSQAAFSCWTLTCSLTGDWEM